MTASRRRLDVAMVERGLAPSRERAQALIAAGLVMMGEGPARSAAQPVSAATPLTVVGRDREYASRAGGKLAHALDAFRIDVAGRVALDAGASAGGFTDVLLRRGAALVYAVDVGHGQLDGRLARDPRVRVLDRTNLRTLRAVPGPAPSLSTLDLSFISLRLVIGAIAALATADADVVALFKPQFELGRDAVGRGGIVRDFTAGEEGARAFLRWVEAEFGAATHGPVASPITGARGNREWLVHLRLAAGEVT